MAKIHLLFVRLVELGSHLHWFPLAIIQWPQWVTFPICHCEFIPPYFPLPLLQGASICWPNNSGFQGVAFMYLSEQGRQVKVLLSAVLPGCGRHCSPSPFATIWGRAVCTKWLLVYGYTVLSCSLGHTDNHVLFSWSSELNTIDHTGTQTPFLAHALGGEATDLPCYKWHHFSATPLLPVPVSRAAGCCSLF